MINLYIHYKTVHTTNKVKVPIIVESALYHFTRHISRCNEMNDVISIETVKLTSSQHRFYFDVHKVCGKLGRGKTALGGW